MPDVLILIFDSTRIAKSKMAVSEFKDLDPSPLGLHQKGSFTMSYSLCVFLSSSKGTIMERAMLITPKEFEVCTNSPSPIRLALSPLPPALVPFFPSLPLHHQAFFLSASLHSNLLLRLLPAGTHSK